MNWFRYFASECRTRAWHVQMETSGIEKETIKGLLAIADAAEHTAVQIDKCKPKDATPHNPIDVKPHGVVSPVEENE